MKNEIVLFNEQNVKLEVNVKDETVQLTLDQMAELFGRDKSVISRHIRNALAEELDNSVVANFATTAPDGKEYLTNYYNLDMIISVGYRVKSKKGVIFRKWANSVLKEYYDILYINDKRIIDNNTLVAITLLIAESNPKEKEVMVDLVMNFLTSY